METELSPETSEKLHILTRLSIRENLIKENDVLNFLCTEIETDALSRNARNKVPTNAATHPRRAKSTVRILYSHREFFRLSVG